MPPAEPKLRFHIFCLTTIVIFSTLEVAGKLFGQGISPYTLTAWRFLIGGLVILPFALRQQHNDRNRLKPGAIVRMGFLGVLNVCLSMLILQLSIFYGKASLAAVIVSMNPLFVSFFAQLLIKEKLRLPQLLGLMTGILGLSLIVLGERDFGSQRYLNLPLGIVFAVIAASNFGLYTVLTKKSVLEHGNLVTNSVSFIIGALILFLLNGITGKPLVMALNWQNVLLTLYLGIILTGTAYLLYFEGMKGLPANQASMYFFLKPVIASLFAWLILNESLTWLQIIAIAIIVLSMNLPRLIKSL